MHAAPPGYVGYDDGGVLTDAVWKRPYQVILLDEFEKAHREVSNLLLQVFDDGRLTDSKGKQVDFRNTIIIMTSNLGSQEFREMHAVDRKIKLDFAHDADAKSAALSNARMLKSKIISDVVSKHFSPEFINRLDDIIVFNPLGIDEITRISRIQFDKVVQLFNKKGIEFQYDDSLLHLISRCGVSQDYGARPLKRLIQNSVLNPLALHILEVGCFLLLRP